MAGKSGTAEKGTGRISPGSSPSPRRTIPQVAVAVVIEDTQSTGGETAAPLAAAVLREALAQADLP